MGWNLPTTFYVTRNPSYALGPTQVIADQATQDHHTVLPSLGPLKEPQDEMAPNSSIGKKWKVVEIAGPIHKIGPVTSQLYQDCLGKLVASLSGKLSMASSWEDFIKAHQGKSYLAPDINHILPKASSRISGTKEYSFPWTIPLGPRRPSTSVLRGTRPFCQPTPGIPAL